MKQSSLLFSGLALVVWVLAGCATSDQRSLTAACSGLATVTVSNITLSPSSVDIDPDPVCINFNSGPAEVRWSFAQPGYQFPADAVTFGLGAPSYRGAVLQGGRAFQVVVDPTALTSWKYTIRFQSTTVPSLSWTCDPTIVNRESSILTRQSFACTTSLAAP